MTGRVLVIGTLCIGLGVFGLTQRIAAQSEDDVEETSTGEIAEETFTADSISDETSLDDDLSDDWPSQSSGDGGGDRPKTPVQPNR